MLRIYDDYVALFTRAWIEIHIKPHKQLNECVALFTRAWIEIVILCLRYMLLIVALFTRAWIEIYLITVLIAIIRKSPSSRGRGLK